MKFVIFHGAFGSPNENWFPNLKKKLESMNQDVISIQFPVDDFKTLKKSQETKQNLKNWFQTFEVEILPKLKSDKEKICFIGHSIANLFILHVVDRYKIKLDCAIFVSPWLDRLEGDDWQFDKVNATFYKTDFDFDKLQKYMPVSYVIYSDTDPYVFPHKALHFAKVLNSSHIMVKRAGHLNAEVNMNEFPLVFDLCVTRLELTLYQKYSYKLEVEDTVDRLRHADRKYINLTPEQLDDEGTFHFMNLSKGGFATFVSNAQDWNPFDIYFEGGRKLAQSGLDLTRVFIIMNKEDLNRSLLKQQMELDSKAGIHVYTLDYEELEKIGCEKDFGIWDNEYVCIMHRDKNGGVIDGLIDARVKSLLTAQNWRDRILRKAKEYNK